MYAKCRDVLKNLKRCTKTDSSLRFNRKNCFPTYRFRAPKDVSLPKTARNSVEYKVKDLTKGLEELSTTIKESSGKKSKDSTEYTENVCYYCH